MNAVLITEIKRCVGRDFGVSMAQIDGRQRTPSVVNPRHVAIYLVSVLTGLSLVAIGRAFGGRDHTTIIHAIARMKATPALRRRAEALLPVLRGIIYNMPITPPEPTKGRLLATCQAGKPQSTLSCQKIRGKTQRQCLRCGIVFKSTGSGNRICPRCHMAGNSLSAQFEGV